MKRNFLIWEKWENEKVPPFHSDSIERKIIKKEYEEKQRKWGWAHNEIFLLLKKEEKNFSMRGASNAHD